MKCGLEKQQSCCDILELGETAPSYSSNNQIYPGPGFLGSLPRRQSINNNFENYCSVIPRMSNGKFALAWGTVPGKFDPDGSPFKGWITATGKMALSEKQYGFGDLI